MTETEAFSIIFRLKAAIDEFYPCGKARTTEVTQLAGHIARINTAWPLEIIYHADAVDRRGDLLSGPLYTSERYPWPRNSGCWCEPVVQINLAQWGARHGRNVGEGLLQSWDPRTGGLIRVIPPAFLTEQSTPPPSRSSVEYECRLAEADTETGHPNWLNRPGRISALGASRLDWQPWHLLRLIQAITDTESNAVPDEPVNFRARLSAIAADLAEPEVSDVHRAFGMCAGNVFITSASDPLPPVLLTIESDDHVFAITGSTFCICYDENVNGIIYSAHLFWE